MRATAAVVADVGHGGVARLPVLRSEAPLMLRRTAEAVYIVAGAAGPIGGDELELRIDVRPGAVLRVRTAAATLALPGRRGQESVLTVTARVGTGARLEFLPEPTVVAAGARHRVDLRADLADGAGLLLRDELILGRHGEPGGCCRTRLRVDLAGAPLLRHELNVDGSDEVSLGPAVLAGHRTVGCVLRVEPAWSTAGPARQPADRPAGDLMPGVAVLPLAGPALLVTALADDAITLRRRLGSRAAAAAAPHTDPATHAQPIAPTR